MPGWRASLGRIWKGRLHSGCGLPPPAVALEPDSSGGTLKDCQLPIRCADTIQPVESTPVFADPSGRRRRVMRRLGVVAAVVLVTCLGAVLVAMAGGPQAPLTTWAAPRHLAPTSRPGASSAANRAASSRPGAQARPQRSLVPGLSPSPSAQVSPKPSPGVTPSPSSSASVSPTNPSGRTPPGQTKSPNPHKSSHAP
jgi:hypothetical protein